MPMNYCGVFASLWKSIRAMGCLFGCFRLRDHTRPLVSDANHPIARERGVASRNRLSSLFISGDEKEVAVKDRENLTRRSARSEVDDLELKDEAKFLKACGTIHETPVEIRKTSKKLKDSPEETGSSDLSKYHSWLPSASTRSLIDNGKQINQTPSPKKLNEDSEDDTFGSCVTNSRDETRVSIGCHETGYVTSAATAVNGSVDEASGSTASSISAAAFGGKTQLGRMPVQSDADSATLESSPEIVEQTLEKADWKSSTLEKTQPKYKSVQFEMGSANIESSPAIVGPAFEKTKSIGNENAPKPSPYPTPLKITDQMQTPGTVFASGNNARIRSQYVYTVVNPSENLSQENKSEEQNSAVSQTFSCEGENYLPPETATPIPELGLRESSFKRDLKQEASLDWLKMPSSSNHDGVGDLGVGHLSKAHRGRNHSGDRPIIGMVAAHWIEDKEVSHIPPKWWDGNGIPNSTTKYKEDQKVSWHATPFEERLEKALSEESVNTQRKPIKELPLVFEELDDADTAASQLQSLSHSKSLVSF